MEERETCLNKVLLECVMFHNQRKEQELTSKISECLHKLVVLGTFSMSEGRY